MAEPPIRVVSEVSKKDIEKNRVKKELEHTLRNMAANLLRIIRGAGKSYDLPNNLVDCLDAYRAFEAAHGHFPDEHTVITALDPDEGNKKILGDDSTDLEWSLWEIAASEDAITMASLQIVASMLVHQRLQETRARNDLNQSIRAMDRYRAQMQALRAAKTKPAHGSKKKNRGGPDDEIIKL